MPDKKFFTGRAPNGVERRGAINLSLNKVIAARGFKVARELGYGASEIVQKMLELLHEERARIPRRQRGDHLQITLFDRVTDPEPEKGKKK